MTLNFDARLVLMVKVLDEKKGINLLTLDLKELDAFTHYLLIVEGSSTTHVRALANAVIEKLRELEKPICVEGMDLSEWVVLDYGSIVLHILLPELRERYRIETLWQKGKIVDCAFVLQQTTNNKSEKGSI